MLDLVKTWALNIMRHISINMAVSASNCTKTYEEAVKTLNTLQSNAAVIEKSRQERDTRRHVQIPQTVIMAERAGVKMSEIDLLSIIHVSGTKGKGSTCAFSESILRQYGYKTGFFSSPHLVEVRERIQINGRPLSKDAFSSYFWDCYRNLDATKEEYGGEMPAYFRFLTIMAFHVFIQEKVDVAIVEVGIGGQYDCTNIIRHPVVCGVSSLGIDHTGILGNTVEKIAWQKAGIFKCGVPAVTVPQPEGALQVLRERAEEIGNPLFMAPNFSKYAWRDKVHPTLGIAGEMQHNNAALAMQLCHMWRKNNTLNIDERQALYTDYMVDRQSDTNIAVADKFEVQNQFITGLESCKWAGRNQKISQPGITYYIDGAHTDSSMQQCSHWFLPNADEELQKVGGKVARVLMFNVTGDRDPASLMQYLVDCKFDVAMFCPNIASREVDTTRADQCNFMVTIDSQLIRCTKSKNSWLQLLSSKQVNPSRNTLDCVNQRLGKEEANTLSNNRITQGIEASGDSSCVHNSDLHSELQHKLAQIASSHDDQTDLVSENQSELVHDGGDNNNSNKKSELTSSRSFQNLDDSGLGSSRIGSEAVSTRCTPDQDPMPCYIFTTIQEALQWVSKGMNHELETVERDLGPLPKVLQEAEHVQVLCTGSLHLVGGVIGLLDPNFNDKE